MLIYEPEILSCSWFHNNHFKSTMAFSTSIVLPFYILLSLSLTSAQRCYTTGNFTTNSPYAKNRNLVLSSLASNTTSNRGFYNATNGQGFEMAHAIAVCRGDLSPQNCSDCISSASQQITKGVLTRMKPLLEGVNLIA